MKTPSSLLRMIARAALNQVGGGFAGDLIVEVLPDMAHDVWEWWSGEKDGAARREEMESLASAGGASIRAEAESVVAELAADRPPEERQALADYLVQVPGMIRRTLRRPADPGGHTVPDDLTPRRAENLLALLPPRLSRFHPGDRPLRDSDWELDRLLGVGGFGEVWLARNPNLPSAPPAALKFCLDPAAARLLRNEAALLDRVMRQGRHPGIVQLNHTYLRAETPCLEYEYVEGGDLAGLIQDWHAEGRAPEPDRAARVAARLAEIIAFAHALEPPIVHRDLKPANVLTFRREDGSVGFKIADFGIGAVAANKLAGETARAATGVRGAYTPLYASPQQMRGDGADPRDDVYALGVIWWQILTGELGEGAPTGLDWSGALAARGMDESLIKLLAACVEPRPESRPANGGELAERLARALAQAVASAPLAPPEPPAAPMPDLEPGAVLVNAGRKYTVGRALGRAARFAMHECPLGEGRPGILKIAASPANNTQLDREAYALGWMAETAARLDAERGEGEPLNYAYFFPELIDSFIDAGHGGRRVNVLGFPKEIVELRQLRPLSSLAEGGRAWVDPRTGAWILGKALKVLAFAHDLGISNGHVDGGNIMIEPERHGVILFDWTLATMHREGSVPRETARREIAQAARAASLAMGGAPESGELPPSDQLVDGRYAEALRRLASGGVSDAAVAHREFYELVWSLWPRKFHPFTTHRKEA